MGAPMSELSKLFQAFRRSRRHHEGAPFLKVSDLCVRYDNLPALTNISFELHGGEYIAVVGRAGTSASPTCRSAATSTGTSPPPSRMSS